MPQWRVEHVETAAGAQLRCELRNGGHGHQCRRRSDRDACNAHALQRFRIGHAGSPRDVDGRTDGFDEGCNSCRIMEAEWINAIRACGEVGLAALDSRVKPRALFAMLEVEDIAAGVENDRNVFPAGCFPSRREAPGGTVDAAHRPVKPILQIDSDHARLNDLSHVRSDFGRSRAIPRFDIGGDRYLGNADDSRMRRNQLCPWNTFPIRVPKRPCDSATRCCQRVEPGSNEEPCAHGIPRIRQQENGRGAVPRKKRLSQLRLSRSVHV
jgi:hypothetical protein